MQTRYDLLVEKDRLGKEVHVYAAMA